LLRYQYKLIAPPILLSALPSSFDSDRSSRTLGELMTGSLVAEAGWEPPNNVDAIKGLENGISLETDELKARR
jgi:hypothetical protein